ncbi:MAG: hypothetical protein K9L62_10855 [Vallitaleaceae bacterium]|nr:hypothetical protein [Vallitaleaceae bacterium]
MKRELLKRKMKGENNPMYGKKHTEVAKKIQSEKGKNRIPWNKGKHRSSETKESIRKKLKGREPWNKGKIGIYSKMTLKKMRNKIVSKETRKKLKDAFTLTIEKIHERYPFFSKIEEMRYNPDKPEKEIQVHCKNYNCENSKEKGGWFTPSYIGLYERIRSLEKDYGNDGSYFYCCEKCKNECPLYGLQSDPFKVIRQYYTKNEHQQFREYVLNRDNYKCQYCGEKAEHAHHERPQKLEPFYALDPDFAWSCCKKCHYEKGHRDECSTGNLANTMCI